MIDHIAQHTFTCNLRRALHAIYCDAANLLAEIYRTVMCKRYKISGTEDDIYYYE